MKTYKTVHAPATTQQVLEKRTCDLCGKESSSADWDADIYEVNETIVRYRFGTDYPDHNLETDYPDNGCGEEYEIDICPDCFVGRLIPWLKSEGAKIEPSEWSW